MGKNRVRRGKCGESEDDGLRFPRIVAPRYAFSEAWESKLLGCMDQGYMEQRN